MNPVKEVSENFFGNIWELFLAVKVPGLDISFAAFLIALFLIRFSIRLFGFVSGFTGMNGGDYGRAATLAEKYKNDREKGLSGQNSKFNWKR